MTDKNAMPFIFIFTLNNLQQTLTSNVYAWMKHRIKMTTQGVWAKPFTHFYNGNL